MISRLYTAVVASSSHSTATTLIQITTPADLISRVERAWISQDSQDTSEQLTARIGRISSTGAGATNTPTPHQVGDSAATATVLNGCTTQPTYGNIFVDKGWNVLSGFEWVPVSDDDQIVISPSSHAGMALTSAPDAAISLSYGMTFREIGG